MKTYRGFRGRLGVAVVVGAPGRAPRVLDPRNDVRNHSPDGFNWGYSGSGPAQLALALLLDVFDGDEQLAHDNYQRFKREVIARIREDYWSLTEMDVVRVVQQFPYRDER